MAQGRLILLKIQIRTLNTQCERGYICRNLERERKSFNNLKKNFITKNMMKPLVQGPAKLENFR